MPKSTKRFVISDESLNRYGFRVLTSGIDLSQFKKNPLCLWMHQRSDKNSQDSRLPIGHWEDIELSNGTITAIPFFSDNDDFAMQIYHKVEEETLRMASAGLDPIEATMDGVYMLPGQELPTLTKSTLYEASICDMGVNNNALVMYADGISLADDSYADYLINLSTGTTTTQTITNILNKNSNTMNPELLALAITLGLSEKATQAELISKITKQNAENLQLSTTNKDLNSEVEKLKNSIEAIKVAGVEKEIETMLSLAVREGKITEAQKPHYVTLAKGDVASVKLLIDSMPKHTSAEAQLAAGTDASDPLLKLSYDQLHKNGTLASVKDKYPEHYASIFKAKFGKDPK